MLLEAQDIHYSTFCAKKADKKSIFFLFSPQIALSTVPGESPKLSDAICCLTCLIGGPGPSLFRFLGQKMDKKSIFSVFGPQSSPYTVPGESPKLSDAIFCLTCLIGGPGPSLFRFLGQKIRQKIDFLCVWAPEFTLHSAW